MKVGIAADHAGFALKQIIKTFLESNSYHVVDFGADSFKETDDYPDYIVPLGQAVADKQVQKGIAVCGSGVGAAIAANKVKGVRAALITDYFSAHQGVEDDDMNLICLGGRITGESLAKELILAFLKATFKDEERFVRRLQKIATLEAQ
jgi:ribose 5-phosphate isomerase B